MEYDKIEQKLEFVGMKQIKEVSLVQSFYPIDNPDYAIGFASANYILWNLSTETKVHSFSCLFLSVDHLDPLMHILILFAHALLLQQVAEIPCGGWRRPHTYFLGDVPEIKNCFAFVKVCAQIHPFA